MDIFAFDHIELIVENLDRTIEFYTKIMGFQIFNYGTDKKTSLIFGNNKINILAKDDFDTSKKATISKPTVGSAGLCFLTNKPLKEIMAFLKANNIEILSGPERHTGATNLLISIYIKDPDGNLIQIANNVT